MLVAFICQNELKTKSVIFRGPKNLRGPKDLICFKLSLKSCIFVLLLLKCNKEKAHCIYYGCTISFDSSCYNSIRKLKLKIRCVVLSYYSVGGGGWRGNRVFYICSLNIVFQCFLIKGT